MSGRRRRQHHPLSVMWRGLLVGTMALVAGACAGETSATPPGASETPEAQVTAATPTMERPTPTPIEPSSVNQIVVLQEPQETLPTPTLAWRDVLLPLLRYGYGQGGIELDVLFATHEYFQARGEEMPLLGQTVTPLIFYITENIHFDELPNDLPMPMLSIDGQDGYSPLETRMMVDDPHHRTSRVLFAGVDAQGNSLLDNGSTEVTLFFPIDGVIPTANIFRWRMPIDYAVKQEGDPVTASIPGLVDIRVGQLGKLFDPEIVRVAPGQQIVLRFTNVDFSGANHRIDAHEIGMPGTELKVGEQVELVWNVPVTTGTFNIVDDLMPGSTLVLEVMR